MTDPTQRPPAPRRGLPANETFMAPATPSRALGQEDIAAADSPLGTTPEKDPSPDGELDGDGPRRRTWAASAVVSLTLLAVVLFFAWPRSPDAPPVALPSTSSTIVHTPSPSRASPSGAPSSSTQPTESTQLSGSTLPSGSTQPTGSLPKVVDPTEPAPPLPGTLPPENPTSAPAEPSPTAVVTAGEVALNDARFTAPEGWTLYGDELIENARRVVRLSHQPTDIRLQAVTLEPSGVDLSSSCGALVTAQQTQFTDVTQQLVVPIGVDAALGTATRCGFTGIRSSDGLPNTVTFTLVSRTSDSHVLILRNTVPEAVANERAGVAQLNAMACEASGSFGVALPLC